VGGQFWTAAVSSLPRPLSSTCCHSMPLALLTVPPWIMTSSYWTKQSPLIEPVEASATRTILECAKAFTEPASTIASLIAGQRCGEYQFIRLFRFGSGRSCLSGESSRRPFRILCCIAWSFICHIHYTGGHCIPCCQWHFGGSVCHPYHECQA